MAQDNPPEVSPSERNPRKTSRAEKLLQRMPIAASGIILVLFASLAIPYYRLSKRVDQRLAAGPFQNTFNYYAAPENLSVGDAMSSADVAASLKRAGYALTSTANGLLTQSPAQIEIQFASDRITAIMDHASGRRLTQYELPPQLVTNLSDADRAKRTMIHYADIPPVLVHAIVSAEDKRFFAHAGLDPLRIAKAVYVDLRQHRKEQGASTISMQLARNLWLDRDKSWKRKFTETLVALHVERKLTKQQIFEDYCNLVYLGGQGTFSIDGFGEAARAYFNKDIHQLNLTESATLAGLIQRPSHLNPLRYPERAIDRRNVVLALMHENKYINDAQYEQAVAAPLGLRPGAIEFSQSQYFFDVASEQAARELGDHNGSAEVYSTLDLRLQDAAEHAIADGMRLVDQQLESRRKRGEAPGRRPQVVLIALDPHTGEVKALCGGRNYAASQFNRVFSKRPPGSVFKPFVYTAAMNTALKGGNLVLTPMSTVVDAPTTVQYGTQTYSPANFKSEYWGQVTLRQALAHSLNAATLKVGEMVGFKEVVDIAHRAGMNEDIKPTPAVVLGAYQVTPLEIARAYTVFANGGVRVEPAFLSALRDRSGAALYAHHPQTQMVLDPRVAFLMVDMLQEVMRSGTAAGVHALGFNLPAAGKTGTSHDGWFAGFTSQLLCVVWVGFDDYGELGLEGAHSALPIWAKFMTQAAHYKQYGDAKPFAPPPGVVRVAVDQDSGNLAGPFCPTEVNSYFIDGTQPTSQCTPQEVEVNFNPDGGVTERPAPPQLPEPGELPHQN
jgi:penicillin-binding protein 1B